MFQSGTDLLQSGPGSPVPVAVELLNKVKALPAVGSLYHNLIKNAKVPLPRGLITTSDAGALVCRGCHDLGCWGPQQGVFINPGSNSGPGLHHSAFDAVCLQKPPFTSCRSNL